jgi:hypothetical protein
MDWETLQKRAFLLSLFSFHFLAISRTDHLRFGLPAIEGWGLASENP